MTTSSWTDAANWLATQHDAMIALLADLVNIDSGSYDKPGVAHVFRRLERHYNQHGLQVQSHVVDGVEAAISVTLNPGSTTSKPVLLMGHCDTVFPTGEAQRRPFRIEGTRAYGPGVADMKAGLVMHAFVLAALHKFAITDHEVIGLFTCDEEIGSPLSKPVITEFAKRAGFAFNGEPGRASGNVITGRKGGVFMEMNIEGKAAHSGANFSEGINAISEAAHKIIELDKLTDLERGITVNVGLISGGQSVNTSAPSAKTAIDLRIRDLEQRNEVVGRIQCICNKSFITGTLAKLGIMGEFHPFVPSPNSQKLYQLYEDTITSIGHHTGQEFSGGCADSGVTSSMGVITLCGTGPLGAKYHTPDEYCEISTIVPRAKAVVLTMAKLNAQQWET
jgi:glutamate carboxypeptidase